MHYLLKSIFSKDLRRKLSKIPSFPTKLVIEPVSYCNLRCPLCPAGTNTLPRPKTQMSLEHFKKIIDQSNGRIQFLRMHGYGEPFLNKHILEMITYAKKKGIDTIIISTNGTQFKNLDFTKKLVQTGLDKIVFSIDGVDQKSHEIYRVGADFKTVINSLKLLVKAKKELHSSTPTIFYQLLVMRHNEHLRSKALSLAKKLGADYFSEKAVLIPDDTPHTFQFLAQRFLPIDPSFNFYKMTPAGYSYQKTFKNDCEQINHTIYVNADGSVYPCCQDSLKPTSPKHPYYVGNAFKEPLEKIWLGKKLKAFRMQVFTNQKNLEPCVKCPLSRHLRDNGEVNYVSFIPLKKQV